MSADRPVKEWDGKQWAKDEEVQPDEKTADPAAKRWNKFEYVGEHADGTRDAGEPPDEMPEGESALSGDRENPGEQHWAEQSRRLRPDETE
jgi:hypothetical protein